MYKIKTLDPILSIVGVVCMLLRVVLMYNYSTKMMRYHMKLDINLQRGTEGGEAGC